MFAGQHDSPVRIDDCSRSTTRPWLACQGEVALVVNRQPDVHRVADTHQPNELPLAVTLGIPTSLISLAVMLASTLRISVLRAMRWPNSLRFDHSASLCRVWIFPYTARSVLNTEGKTDSGGDSRRDATLCKMKKRTMPVNIASIRSAAVNLCLLLVSCVAGLALCEVSLRLFYPKYRHLAEAQFHTDAMRIWARTPNSRGLIHHPDTHVVHFLHHNNLALRQHRDFSEADLDAATNIGVFGDSFTENISMAVQYSFTEPLDYLLNQGQQRFNVLNFGVHGYGPGQSLLHYEHFRYAKDLDHIFFVYCEENDIDDIYEMRLFHLDEAGHLVRNEAIRESGYVSLLGRLHTAYLVLDVIGRWSSGIAETATYAERLRSSKSKGHAIRDARRRGKPDQDHDSRQNSLAIFRQLIRRWKHLAEHNGSTFSVVLLPAWSDPVIVDLLNAEDVAIIDLNACFGTHDPAHHDRAWINSPYRFRNDYHWNEAGNQLAALCLYRFLEKNMGLPRLSEERLMGAVSRYYAAFAGGTPLKTRGGAAEGAVSSEAVATIREKYLALDMSNPSKEEFIKMVAQPDKRIIASDFDIYLHQDRLFYVKEDCRQADMEAEFFLHVIPVYKKSLLREFHRKRGFHRKLPFRFAQQGLRIGKHGCAVMSRPILYPSRYIRTGQYLPDGRRVWEGEGWIDPNNRGEERPEFPAVPATRIIDADFDVYLDGRLLVYHKADCGPADREPPFFLQVTPTDATVLPQDRRQAGFAQLDFNACTIERRLPAYAIRHIRTGQYTEEGRLWEAAFTLEQAKGGREDERSATSQRTVRSVFDVVLEGQRLFYNKVECRTADREAPFFLHVIPMDERDLPAHRRQYGFDNLDFEPSSKFAFHVDEFGCTRTVPLPSYAIAHIRTGQYMPGTGRLWEGEFAMEQD